MNKDYENLFVQVHQLLSKATQNRAVAETKCNERSSRSHSVFRLRLTGINKVTEEKCLGRLFCSLPYLQVIYKIIVSDRSFGGFPHEK